ncbi:RNA polymerase sigma factor [Croceiramulus getboli]|nr:RNA polymerase sigma factor [Flavobacteriaceae bacterium YJPT1-3]
MTLTNQHIDSLLELCQQGDSRAQCEVYERYYQAMYNTALRIVKHTAAAEDIMQEAFLKAFTKLDHFQGTASFGSWLKRIVINHSLNYYQKQQKRNEVDLNGELYGLADEAQGIDTSDASQEVRRILKAMNGLKDNYRIALSLHLIEGYDYEEMCEILDLSYANCRTIVSRAKESLRKQLCVS